MSERSYHGATCHSMGSYVVGKIFTVRNFKNPFSTPVKRMRVGLEKLWKFVFAIHWKVSVASNWRDLKTVSHLSMHMKKNVFFIIIIIIIIIIILLLLLFYN